LSGLAFSQTNPRGLSSVTLDGHKVSVDYGRPSLKGKTVEAAMKMPFEPGHGFWRLGADSSTTFTTATALKFGKVTVPKGIYSLYAQREGANSWRLVFNKKHGQWGTHHDPSADFAFVPFRERKTSSTANELVIDLMKTGSGATFLVHWGDMELTTHFRAAS
ncbi:MAG: DUF2911 domain-containing protein, partial [Terriglobia bacterium]